MLPSEDEVPVEELASCDTFGPVEDAETFNPLPPSPPPIQVPVKEENEVKDVPKYTTRSGRTVKPIQTYVPHMDSRKKYNELHDLTIGSELEYSCELGSVVAYVLQQMHIKKPSKSMVIRQSTLGTKK